jgi:hypothetical protein
MEIDGVDLVLLDDAIIGTASHYDRNSRPLSAEHRSLLEESLRGLDGIWEDLTTEEARAHFARTRAVGVYLLEQRFGPAP